MYASCRPIANDADAEHLFSNNCTFSSSPNLNFSLIHRISRRPYRLTSTCKLPIAVSKARRRSSLRSLLLEGDPPCDDGEARGSCSSSDDELEAWQREASSVKAERMPTISVGS